jgi:membrane fusion protein (multidrug efflux system)
MKTKTRRRIAGFSVTAVLTALVVLLLMKNRKDMQDQLTAMQNFNEIVPVEIAIARLADFIPEFTESGVFLSNSDVKVISETQGKIRLLNFQVGSKVNAGQVLATVENNVAKSRFELAKEDLKKAEKDLERFRKLEGGEAATQQQLEAAKLDWKESQASFADAQEQLENTILKAPISGTISERCVEQGTWLTPGMHVCTVSDQSHMNFHVKLAGTDLQGLSTEQPVNLKTDALPGYTFTGKVKNIGVAADLSGRYLVEINVLNSKHLLRSGMVGQATFNLPAEKNRLIIPRKCIDGSLQQAHVFVLNSLQVTRRPVTVELLDNESVAVVSGLQPGDKVVKTGQINLTDGTSVKVINN